ncbi:hypothetical protein M501DRAFT_960244 [Patellaria atrata CBS 101060]|uniref:Vacuolar protein sorting-associated protein 8 central domain-containing protein n=1 Tax=Patellaria atrata CBS 101060 TaxID=1346257 RepID=A0A9P4S536_9PEZI|nr:hypothetical protein M501DRAFT_960244 [Patellaria atrata CBS 101060]
MSSTNGGSEVSDDNQDVSQEVVDIKNGFVRSSDNDDASGPSDIAKIIQEEREHIREEAVTGQNGMVFHKVKSKEESSETQSIDLPHRSAKLVTESPEASVASTPDDIPSIQGSLLSSPGSSVPASYFSSPRPGNRPSLQPFERRFSARLSPSPLASPRALSPAFLNTHSRHSSISSQLVTNQDESETPQPPWEVVRWTKLKKITGQAFSEVGKRNWGRPTCLVVTASIAIGTSKGLILIFDYQQTLKSIIGLGTKAIESGTITSLSFSADHSNIASGHASGNIFTWELNRPAKPFLHISPINRAHLQNRSSDGHISGAAVLHIGFLGTRHTALVSADDAGMSFSHLATRGLGAVGRTVKTARILGRYPSPENSSERPRKPSSVLAFAPLPLGNIGQPTDTLGLTALLTPYLLVIVSTTPVAETQHKSSRPKELAPHSTLSGCLAWFPAVRLKNPPGESKQTVSKTKLVYCWSNILTVLDVEATESPDKDKRPELHFQPRSRWRGEEAIVAVQWLSRSVLALLTISQRLFILEDNSLRVTDSFDLIHKHIYHHDLFSKQLQPVVEQLDEQDVSMHGVVADAFHMSFRAYKGRLFLLGFNDVSIGSLSNWADRLFALMEEGDYIAAIALATSYYNGDADRLTVGLPEDDTARHGLVQEKLLEMITASLKYTFGQRDSGKNTEDMNFRLSDLTASTFTACLSMEELDFLFEDVYDKYEESSAEGIFFEILEPYILEEEITSIPPNVLKELITFYASQERTERLEEMICHLETQTMDINQVTSLCKQHTLYDALVYVWTQAIEDYITPLIDILSLIKVLVDSGEMDEALYSRYHSSAMKLFPFLAYALTGRVYPSGNALSDDEASKAKGELYWFLFSNKAVAWPQGSREVFNTTINGAEEPVYPYLRLIMRFDTGSLMSMLNEAFEDSFLNGTQTPAMNGSAKQQGVSTTLTPTRQYIVTVLLGLVTSEDLEREDAIYIYMFLARNLPKFPQHIVVPGSSMHNILVGLCNYPSEEIADDCQLSVEYLLSAYKPSDIPTLIPAFERASFHRVLKSVYRAARNYPKLLQAYFDDEDNREEIFDYLEDCLRPSRGLSKKQVTDVQRVIVKHAKDLASIDTARTALTLKQYAPQLLQDVLDALEDGSYAQFIFLRVLLEPELQSMERQTDSNTTPSIIERYIRLMCSFDPPHVSDYVALLTTSDLRLGEVLPAMESSGVIDAAIVLMARDGLVRDAMDRLVKHLDTLEVALTGLIDAAAESPDASNTEETAEDLLEAVEKYVKVGIWLCQGQTRAAHQSPTAPRPKNRNAAVLEADLALHELLWLDLIDVSVALTRTVSSSLANPTSAPSPVNAEKITSTLRSFVQDTFTALLAATSTSTSTSASKPTPPTDEAATRSSATESSSFLLVLRAFLTRASARSPTLQDLRQTLAAIFAAYAFESTLLALANAFLDKDVFGHVQEVGELRQRGWRPRGQVCEGCRRRVWGPGVGGAVWESWERREGEREGERRRRWVEGRGGVEARRLSRGKGVVKEEGGDGEGEGEGEGLGPLVVFACRHLWHRRCLEKERGEGVEGEGLRCPICV